MVWLWLCVWGGGGVYHTKPLSPHTPSPYPTFHNPLPFTIPPFLTTHTLKRTLDQESQTGSDIAPLPVDRWTGVKTLPCLTLHLRVVIIVPSKRYLQYDHPNFLVSTPSRRVAQETAHKSYCKSYPFNRKLGFSQIDRMFAYLQRKYK